MSETLLVGQSVETSAEESFGSNEATSFVAVATGKANKLKAHIVSVGTESFMEIAIWAKSAEAGKPGTLLAAGKTVAKVPAGGGTFTVTIPATTITAGETYWLGLVEVEGAGAFTVKWKGINEAGRKRAFSSGVHKASEASTWTEEAGEKGMPIEALEEIPKLELTNPTNQKTKVNKSVSLAVIAANYTSVTAAGMPTGMAFNSGTLKFEGTPTVEGNFEIKVTAKNSTETKVASFFWEVEGITAPKTSGIQVIPSIWTFQVTGPESEGFKSEGEFLNIHRANVTIPLSKVRTASLEVRLDNPLAKYVAVNAEVHPMCLKAYRKGKLLFFGPIQDVEEVGDENQNASVAISATGPEYIFTERLVGKTAEGLKLAAGTSRAVRFKELCEASNNQESGDMNVDFGLYPITSTNTEAFEAQSFQYLSDVLKTMFEQTGGFDWTVHPIEPKSTSGFGASTVYRIGSLEMKDLIYTEQPNAVFEWGTGRLNINSFKRKVNLTQMANRGYNFTSGGPEAAGAPTIAYDDPGNSQKTWGRRETLVNLSILNEAARKKFVEETIAVRKAPRQTIEFSPINQLEGETGAARVPAVGFDYEVGDAVRARVVYEGETHLDAMVRVWAWSGSLDENGKETESLTLSAT